MPLQAWYSQQIQIKMPIRFSQPGFGLSLIVTAGLLFFTFGAFQVVAQNYLEPTGAAPESNVIDFINETSTAQARYGKVIINAADPSVIPDSGAPFLQVKGSALFLGTVSFDVLTSSKVTWYVNPQTTSTPSYVTSGTYTPLGKLTVSSAAGAGVNAQSATSNAVSVGTTVEFASSVYGEVVPPPGTIGISAGVKATANANGIGLYALQSGCTGSTDPNNGGSPSKCGVAGNFEGNFIVVNGQIIGDGRNIYRAFSILDQGSIGNGIGIKTFEISSVGTISPTIAADETFLSMSAYVGNKPYDPNDTNIQITYNKSNPSAQSLTVTWTTTPTPLPVVVQIYYYKRFGAMIVSSPQGGNIVTAKNFQVGSGTSYQFYAALNGGSSAAGQFTWSLYKDSNFINPCNTNVLDPDHCGAITSDGVYTPPSAAPTGNKAWVVAKWAGDPTVYAFAELDLYIITITPPDPAVFYINGPALPFTANAVGPSGNMPVTWSVVQSPTTDIGYIGATTGVFTPVATISSGGIWPWYGKVKATISSIPEAFFATSNDMAPIPKSSDISIAQTFTDGVQAGLPANQQVGTGNMLTLTATVSTVPTQYQHTFSWSLASLDDSLDPLKTDATTQAVTYTAADSLDIMDPTQRARTISVTWNGQAASSSVILYPGETSPQLLSFNVTANGTSTSTLSVNNFNTAVANRAIYSINGTLVTGTVGQSIPTPCGTLTITAITDSPSGGCTNPATQQCTRAYTIRYNAAAAACTAIVPVVLSADRRETSIIRVQTTSTPSCFCSGCGSPYNYPCGFKTCQSCCGICQSGTIIDPGGGGAN